MNSSCNSGDFHGPPRQRDRWGSGDYEASRDGGSRTHAGIDYGGAAGSNVIVPMNGTVEIINGGVRITGRIDGVVYSIRILHIDVTVVPGRIQEGAIIGTVSDLTPRYPGITNHAHLELYRVDNGVTTRLDPGDFIPEYNPLPPIYASNSGAPCP